MKKLVIVMLVGSLGWFLKEVMELGLGTRTSVTLGLTSIFDVVLAIGIWGLYFALLRNRGASSHVLGLLGAGLISVGSLILCVPPMKVARSWDLELVAVVRESTLYMSATAAVLLGTLLFGVSLLRAGTRPRWAVHALLACPLLAAGVQALGWSLSILNLVLGAWALALVALTFSVMGPWAPSRDEAGSEAESPA